jgi:hypothetical protein
VGQSHNLPAASWGQAEKDAWGEDKCKDNKKEKHNKVHFIIHKFIFFIGGPLIKFASFETKHVTNSSSLVLVLG